MNTYISSSEETSEEEIDHTNSYLNKLLYKEIHKKYVYFNATFGSDKKYTYHVKLSNGSGSKELLLKNVIGIKLIKYGVKIVSATPTHIDIKLHQSPENNNKSVCSDDDETYSIFERIYIKDNNMLIDEPNSICDNYFYPTNMYRFDFEIISDFSPTLSDVFLFELEISMLSRYEN